MRRKLCILLTVIFLLLLGIAVLAGEPKKDTAIYKKRVQDSILKLISDNYKKLTEEKDKVTEEIVKKHKDLEKQKKEKQKVLRFDLSKIKKPVNLEQFKKQFHFPPVAQYATGTCWCFSQTSMYESEIKRLYGEEVKLSEMYTVYWEFVEKARAYVRERGNSHFENGSEGNAVDRIWKKYGVVPASAYEGVLSPDKMYNHDPMFKEMRSYLQWVKENNFWEEEIVADAIKGILNKHMGVPPKEFIYKDKTYTPETFFKEVVRLNLDDYVQFQSTLSLPFWVKGLFDVPDNWWFSEEYYNVPIDDFMNAIDGAISKGFTIAIGGDVSEPGYNGWEKACLVPTFDIPGDFIDQSSRELRIYNKTTEDDHGIHIVGYKTIGDHYWYLIKDSARSARQGKFEGYHFYRDDYVKLKMLTFSVHKDAVKGLLAKVEKNKPKEAELKLEPDGSFDNK